MTAGEAREAVLLCDEPANFRIGETIIKDSPKVVITCLGGIEQKALKTSNQMRTRWAMSKISAGMTARSVREGKMDEQEVVNFAVRVVTKKNTPYATETIKGSKFERPLFEISGACAGCGETP